MKLIVRTALAGAARMLIGSEWWGKVRETVVTVSKEDIPGEEKQAVVVATIRGLGWALAGWVLHLVIEIAVAVAVKTAADLEKQ